MTDPLVLAARDARGHAYCPYSGFAVGAALETDDGRVFVGCNVENAAYGATLCAERAALAAAIGAGARKFRRLVVVADAQPPVAPCGACRQALAEFGLHLAVESVSPTGERRWQLAALLPDAFTLHPPPGRAGGS